MTTLSRLWTPAGSSGSINSIGDFIFNIATRLSWDCYQFSSFKHCWNIWLMMMFTQFSGCYFGVRIFLIIIIWIFSFGRDNYFYQCVAIVGSQFTFFHCLISYLHQCFANLNFSLQFSNTMTLLFFALFAHLPSFLFSWL